MSSFSSAGAAPTGSSTSAGPTGSTSASSSFESFRADIRDRLEERPNGTLIDFSDRDLTIFLRDVDKDDVRASDFILEPPIM